MMAKEVTRDLLLRLPVELFKQLEREVKIQRSNRTKLVRQALTEYLNGKQLDRDFERDFKSESAKEAANMSWHGDLVEAISEMALRCYGYGRWDAPYWFIGPEQGQSRKENGDLKQRLAAWRKLGSMELCDCEEFHLAINEHSWHRDGKLQSTWRSLILLLMTFLNRPTDKESLRSYQRSEWGRTNGETCVIELSGLAANNLTVPRDRETFRQERIRVIRERMRENHPQLVVMYGTAQRQNWEKIAGGSFPPDNVLVSDGAILALTPHPVKHGLSNAYWEELGQRLRSVALDSKPTTNFFT
jgi:hypothetical protein